MPPRPRRLPDGLSDPAHAGSRVSRASRARGRARRALRISELLRTGQQSFSFEFMPPKTEVAERQLWRAIRQLEPLNPTFVSVTYGAGGSTRDRTVRITGRIAEQTSLTPVGHLTAVLRQDQGIAALETDDARDRVRFRIVRLNGHGFDEHGFRPRQLRWRRRCRQTQSFRLGKVFR